MKPDPRKTGQLAELFGVPHDARGEAWAGQVRRLVLDAAHSEHPDGVISTPSGLSCLAMRLGGPGAPGLRGVLERCTEEGLGVVINPSGRRADWLFSFGDLWSLRVRGALDAAPAAAAPGGVIEAGTKLYVGEPADGVFPPFARRAVAGFLRRGGLERPKVIAMHAPGVDEGVKLAFNFYAEDFPDEEAMGAFVERLRWYFPDRQAIAVLPRSEGIAQAFEAVRELDAAADGLWDWLDPDAARLRREGKTRLAELAGRLSAGDHELAFLREGAAEASRAGEPCWELLFRHWAAQEALFREPRPLSEAFDEAIKAKALAERPACSACPQRFCAQESLFNAYFLIDPPGYAAEVARSCEKLLGEVRAGLDCARCFILMRGEAFIELGRAAEARALLAELARAAGGDQIAFVASLLEAWACESLGDPTAMRDALLRARGYLAREGAAPPNEDNMWLLRELDLRLALAQGKLEKAVALYKERVEPRLPAHSAEAVRAALALARGLLAAGRAREAETLAATAAKRAEARGMLRYGAEARLVAASAASAEGDDGLRAVHAAELSALLPRLLSRDLDEPARAVGAFPALE